MGADIRNVVLPRGVIHRHPSFNRKSLYLYEKKPGLERGVSTATYKSTTCATLSRIQSGR